MRITLVLVALLVVGCSTPHQVENNGPPTGYVSQEEYDALQQRFDALLAEHHARISPELLVVREELDIAQAELAEMQEINAKTSGLMEEATAQLRASKEQSRYPPASQRIHKVEQHIAVTTNWSKLWEDDQQRRYGHTTGVRVTFEEPAPGWYRLRMTYEPEDKLQGNMASAMWLLINGIGGSDNSLYERNTQRIRKWLDEPTEVLLLEGGLIHASVIEGRTMQVDTYYSN